MELSESMKILRKELGITQAELASALHVNCMSVSRWEVGKTVPQSKTIEAILNLAKGKGASQRCIENLQGALADGHKDVIRVPKSNLYPVDRESICELVDGSHNAIYVCDIETDELLYANHKAEEYAGRPFCQGEKCYEFLYGRAVPCLQCPKEQMSEYESSNYHMVSSNDGRHYHFRGRKLNWNGKMAHAQYFFEEKTALEEENGMQSLVNELDAGICACFMHDSGRIEIVYMSDGYFSIVGSSREKRTQYAGYGIMNEICEEDRDRVMEVALDAGKRQKNFRMRYMAVLDNGALKELYIRAKFIRRYEGKSLYYCTVEDIDCDTNNSQGGGNENGI